MKGQRKDTGFPLTTGGNDRRESGNDRRGEAGMVKGALYKVSQPVILSEAPALSLEGKNLTAPAVETRQDASQNLKFYFIFLKTCRT